MPTRPLLRYHGGKWILAPWIISCFPSHRIYVEPYCGAASVLLRKPRSFTEVINDLDDEVCNLFAIVRDRGPELARVLSLTPFSRTEYYAAMPRARDPLERARRLVVRSFMGFGSDSCNPGRRSGFRARSERSGTTPAHDWLHYPESLSKTIARLRGVVIENRPALKIISEFDRPDTLFYCDPPYVHSTRMLTGHQKHCYRYEMLDDEHAELSETLHNIKGMAIVSGYACPLYSRLYRGWRIAKSKAFADGARERTEVLWISPAVPKGLFQ